MLTNRLRIIQLTGSWILLCLFFMGKMNNFKRPCKCVIYKDNLLLISKKEKLI